MIDEAEQLKFIDLFSGLGGFHEGLSSLNFECVFASEIDLSLRSLYADNFKIEPAGDIREINAEDIPEHDLLCAGFPCQPFSKAGSQNGMNDLHRGTLFDDISRIIKFHKPKYFILENVANLKNHDRGRTWDIISHTLEDILGYEIDNRKLSPHLFGIPQIRERIFIVGARDGLTHFSWPEPLENSKLSIDNILEPISTTTKYLPARESTCLDLWQEFVDRVPANIELPSFPIWTMEFGADYPIDQKAPYHLKREELDDYLGSFGQSLHGMTKHDQLERLPKYARTEQENEEFPKWKQRFILQNREYYNRIKKYVDPVLPEIQKMPPSWQKFEWNCKGESRNIRSHIVQFRGSGIRVKRRNYSPALVASTSTQIPIIGWENRYISIKEASKLQSLERLKMPNQFGTAFKALGNAVNARIVSLIAEELIKESSPTSLKHNKNINGIMQTNQVPISKAVES
ncbi:MAG: DNA (cytosine-5-)-methyltransferase [Imperialibacter sp.]|uniref:DNA cytosine methyltransferase n=1 Tax=Imperialibacter sp. TaxID=2038411 RepID=UPI0032F014F6